MYGELALAFAGIAVALALLDRIEKLEACIRDLCDILEAMAEHVDFTMEDER